MEVDKKITESALDTTTSLNMSNDSDISPTVINTQHLEKSNSTIENIENYINEKYDQIAIAHLKDQIVSEIKVLLKSNTNGIPTIDLEKHNSFLLNEVYFLREEVREKNVLIRALTKQKDENAKCCNCFLHTQGKKMSSLSQQYLKEQYFPEMHLEIPPSPLIPNTDNITLRKNQSKGDRANKKDFEPLISFAECSGLQERNQPDTPPAFVSITSIEDSDNQNAAKADKVNTAIETEGNIDNLKETESVINRDSTESTKNSTPKFYSDIPKEAKESVIEKAKDNAEKQKDKTKNKTPIKKADSNSNPKKSVIILGDSIVKNLNSWEMSSNLKNCKVKVMSFSGATIECMQDYMKPSIRDNPNHFILHVGTNNLNSTEPAIDIAQSIIKQALTLKNEKHDVSVSSIILRKDNWNNKAIEVNENLKELCEEKNIFFIDHSNSIKQRHLNRSRLHLNMKGSAVLGKTFVNHISNILN